MLNDAQIRRDCTDDTLWFAGRSLVSPFSESVQTGISYGLTSAGYDARLDSQVLVYKTTRWEPVDPKRFKDDLYRRQMFDEYGANEYNKIVRFLVVLIRLYRRWRSSVYLGGLRVVVSVNRLTLVAD